MRHFVLFLFVCSFCFLILFSVGYWYKCSAYIFTYTITNLYSQKQASRGVLLVLKMNSKLIKIKLWFLKNTYKISVLFKLQSSMLRKKSSNVDFTSLHFPAIGINAKKTFVFFGKSRYGCSPANLLHIFRIFFPKITFGGLLLTFQPYGFVG